MPRKYPWLNILLITLMAALYGVLMYYGTHLKLALQTDIALSVVSFLFTSLIVGWLLQLFINIFRKNKQSLFQAAAFYGFYVALILLFLRLGVLAVVVMAE